MCIRIINKLAFFIFIGLSNPVIAEGTLEAVPNEENIASFELKSIDGKIYRLSDYQGNVVLVNFWASWCPPCLQEIPSMQRLEKSLLNLPFKIVAINVAEHKTKVIYQSKRNNITFTVLLDPQSTTFNQWQAKILPTSFIVDKQGHIRYQVQGSIEWDDNEVYAIIAQLLSE